MPMIINFPVKYLENKTTTQWGNILARSEATKKITRIQREKTKEILEKTCLNLLKEVSVKLMRLLV